jgi:hypothetical protein
VTDHPANQVALAKVYTDLRGAKGKTYRGYLEFASQMMNELRDLGFRIVPFPPLKAGGKINGKAGKSKRSRKRG